MSVVVENSKNRILASRIELVDILSQFFSAAAGLLTKFGYITKIEKNNWKLYTNNSYIMPNPSKLKKKSNATKIFWLQKFSKLRVDTFKLQLKM